MKKINIGISVFVSLVLMCIMVAVVANRARERQTLQTELDQFIENVRQEQTDKLRSDLATRPVSEFKGMEGIIALKTLTESPDFNKSVDVPIVARFLDSPDRLIRLQAVGILESVTGHTVEKPACLNKQADGTTSFSSDDYPQIDKFIQEWKASFGASTTRDTEGITR